MEEYKLSLEKSVKHMKIADHMIYTTYPLLKDKRLLLKILEELYNSALNLINAVLQYDYLYKRINLYQDSRANFQTFRDKCASRFGISREQVNSVLEIFSLIEKHRQSPIEFMKRDQLVIMSDGIKIDTLSIEKMKIHILNVKDMIRKVSVKLLA